MLAHELQRIKDALKTDARSLDYIIANSTSVPASCLLRYHNNSWTARELKKLVDEAKKLDNNKYACKKNLSAHFEKLNINLFLMDPVPGSHVFNLIPIGWQEKNFYRLPNVVNKACYSSQNMKHLECLKQSTRRHKIDL